MGIGNLPKTMLGSPDVYVLTSRGSNSILNSRMDAALSDQLLTYGFVDHASPEVFAFTTIRNNAVVVRGVDFNQFMHVEGATLSSGRLPVDPSEALVGNRLAERLDIKIGDRFPLTGSFEPSVSEVVITGILKTDSGVADELIVSLPVARCMSGISPDYVSIIRITGDMEDINMILAPTSARFSIYDLSIPKAEIGVGSTVQISLKVKNWGYADGQAHIIISDKTVNSTILETDVNVTQESSKTIFVNYSLNEVGIHFIRADLFGEMPQNITENITARNPFLVIIAPMKVAQYHNFTVRVLDQRVLPVDNATVNVEGAASYKTNVTGYCIVNKINASGNYLIRASASGYEEDNFTVEIVNSSTLPQSVQTEIYQIVLNPNVVRIKENCTVTISFENFGNKSGTSAVDLYLNGNLIFHRSYYLNSLESRTVFINYSFTTTGDKVFTSTSQSATLTVESKYQLNPALVQFLLRYGGTGSLDPSRGSLVYSTAKISEGNILIVLVSLAVLTGTLVTFGVSISFMKEINDNLKIIGILRTIGASSNQLLAMIFKQALLLSLPAVAMGLVGGILLADIISMSNQLIAFGHLIQPVFDPNFLILAATGSIIICIGSSLIAGISISRRIAIRMIKGLKAQMVEQPTLKELLGDE